MVDREKVIRELENIGAWHTHHYNQYHYEYAEKIHNAIILLKEQPEIVRCKDCIHWDKGHTEECDNSDSVCFHNGWCKPDWFCADGRSKENA